MDPVAESMHVKKRKRQQQTIRRRHLPASQQVNRVYGEIVVRQEGAFRAPVVPEV